MAAQKKFLELCGDLREVPAPCAPAPIGPMEFAWKDALAWEDIMVIAPSRCQYVPVIRIPRTAIKTAAQNISKHSGAS
jgi:hypothetical protein